MKQTDLAYRTTGQHNAGVTSYGHFLEENTTLILIGAPLQETQSDKTFVRS
jgi:hypothetical protein